MNLKLHSYREEQRNDILAPLTQELFEAHFKQNYLKSLSKKDESSFDELLELTLQELDVQMLSEEQKEKLLLWYENIHHLAFLRPQLTQKDLREIITHHEKEGQKEGKESLEKIHFDLLSADYQMALEVLALRHHVAWNFSQPFASFPVELHEKKYRATLVHESVSPLKKSKLFLRRLSCQTLSLEDFDLPQETVTFLKNLIAQKKNILVAGSTGSGKTTFLKSLMQTLPQNEHLVVIEDTHELFGAYPFTSYLLGENLPHKTMKDHCAYAMRMRPDRMVIGEMRSAEVVPFLLAMNTGHKGLMSTLHANSAADALGRLALLFTIYGENQNLSYELIMKLVCKNIDYVVFLEERKVKQMIKVLGVDGTQPFFNYCFGEEQAYDEQGACFHNKTFLQ